MKNDFKRASGISLIIGSICMVFTMVLHPTGGNIEHILHIKNMAIISHSLAIFSLPFVCFGYWGLSITLQTRSKISILALIFSCMGLIAALIAATINGITLPLYLGNIMTEQADVNTVRLIMRYGSHINLAMDYILMLSLGFAMSMWSILIIQHKQFNSLMGYYGILVVVAGIILGVSGYHLTGVKGFSGVVFGMVSWFIWVALKVLIGKGEKTIPV